MADWGDDDDFGGFESAVVADVSSNPIEVANVASDSNGQTTNLTLKPDSDSAQVQILDWILSNAPKPQSDPTDVGSISQESLSSISQGEQLKDRLNDSSEIARNLDDSFSASGEASSSSVKDSGKEENPPSARSEEFYEAKNSMESVINDEPKIEKTVEENSEALHKLQAELDAALIMKEQTEKSLENLREELKELQKESSKEIEENKEKHEKEIENIKKQHQDEISELRQISEETVSLLTKQYSEVWKLFEKEKSIVTESNANSIMEKCLELLQQQQVTLSNKLDEDRIKQESELKETLGKEKENMENELKERMEKEKVILEEEMNSRLKETMTEEAKHLQEVYTSTLKEAMTTQQTHFEEVLRSTLESERKKFAEVLKSAVKDARETTEKLAEEKREVEARRMQKHTMAVKMLLTSALQQVEQNFFIESDDNKQTEDL